ncbi:GNAT family N-acetyltransferase [Paenibacillus sp. M1]|uniref:GNAT family N-acetyltransferase n=1 Tax=Paenibacillus haidiansis TaxID=1574488 RepID=A0ABU7VMV7_9BACL
MIINQQVFQVNDLSYTIRSANVNDAEALSELRVRIDGETENMDREKGEAFIDTAGFRQIINKDAESPRNLFLVAALDHAIVGYSRCEGVDLSRFAHKAEFGVCVLKDFWGHAIGRNLLQQSLVWADDNDITKLTLNVLETNEKAIKLYESFGFEIEGLLKNDRRHSDGKYYNTVIMGRFKGLLN